MKATSTRLPYGLVKASASFDASSRRRKSSVKSATRRGRCLSGCGRIDCFHRWWRAFSFDRNEWHLSCRRRLFDASFGTPPMLRSRAIRGQFRGRPCLSPTMFPTMTCPNFRRPLSAFGPLNLALNDSGPGVSTAKSLPTFPQSAESVIYWNCWLSRHFGRGRDCKRSRDP